MTKTKEPYVVTFYSFKGGVGRTLALSNVAASLAISGKKVLLVDFDLEAPGLDSQYFPMSQIQKCTGLTGYIQNYLKNKKPSSFDKGYYYEYQLESSKDRGMDDSHAIHIMPAGTMGPSDIDMSSFDWQKFYKDQDGYLLFEYLREEWARCEYDYVLIDSRTGLCEESGICTRQLPNCVCLLYMLDDQNKNGIKRIADKIEKEMSISSFLSASSSTSKRNHETYVKTAKRLKSVIFVESGIPFLDDKDGILEKKRTEFNAIPLMSKSKRCSIERYQTLELIKKPLFVQSEPRSRLSRQFTDLRSLIALDNPNDPEVTIAKLEKKISTNNPPAWIKSSDVLSDKQVTFKLPSDWDSGLIENDLRNLMDSFEGVEEVLLKILTLMYVSNDQFDGRDTMKEVLQGGADSSFWQYCEAMATLQEHMKGLNALNRRRSGHAYFLQLKLQFTVGRLSRMLGNLKAHPERLDVYFDRLHDRSQEGVESHNEELPIELIESAEKSLEKVKKELGDNTGNKALKKLLANNHPMNTIDFLLEEYSAYFRRQTGSSKETACNYITAFLARESTKHELLDSISQKNSTVYMKICDLAAKMESPNIRASAAKLLVKITKAVWDDTVRPPSAWINLPTEDWEQVPEFELTGPFFLDFFKEIDPYKNTSRLLLTGGQYDFILAMAFEPCGYPKKGFAKYKPFKLWLEPQLPSCGGSHLLRKEWLMVLHACWAKYREVPEQLVINCLEESACYEEELLDDIIREGDGHYAEFNFYVNWAWMQCLAKRDPSREILMALKNIAACFVYPNRQRYSHMRERNRLRSKIKTDRLDPIIKVETYFPSLLRSQISAEDYFDEVDEILQKRQVESVFKAVGELVSSYTYYRRNWSWSSRIGFYTGYSKILHDLKKLYDNRLGKEEAFAPVYMNENSVVQVESPQERMEFRIELGSELLVLATAHGGTLIHSIQVLRHMIKNKYQRYFPSVHIKDNLVLDSHQYQIYLNEDRVAVGKVYKDQIMVFRNSYYTQPLHGIEAKDPIYGTDVVWVSEVVFDSILRNTDGNAVPYGLRADDVICRHLFSIAEKNLKSFPPVDFGQQGVHDKDVIVESYP